MIAARTLSIVFVVAGVLAAAAPGFAAPTRPQLPTGWSHAEVNVTTKRGPHTLIYDRGHVVAVDASSLTLREPDGSVVTVGLTSATEILIDGQPGTPSQILRRDAAQTMCIDGKTATRVRVHVTPAALTPRGDKRVSPTVVPPQPSTTTASTPLSR
ncbi:MAG: hypothetical protein WCH31_08875 [Actinomycetes bacterium]